MALKLGKLLAVVGALHFHRIVGLFGGHYQTVADRHFDHVGQVVLALHVVVRQTPRPVGQAIGRDREDTGVTFVDGTLSFGRVLVLDDGGDFAVGVANDTAVTSCVVQLHGKQTHLPWHDQLEQTLQGFNFDQRHVTVKNQHGVSFDERYSLGHGMAGP
ncbi:hypothetical protein D3C85_1319190 [compost metagenome]